MVATYYSLKGSSKGKYPNIPLSTLLLTSMCIIFLISPTKPHTILLSDEMTFTVCANQTTSDYSLNSISFDNPPGKGEQVVMTLTGSAIAATTLNWIRFDIYQGSVRIQEDQQAVDPPQSYSPQSAVQETYGYKFPDVIPAGTYKGQSQFISQDSGVSGCWEFDFTIASEIEPVERKETKKNKSRMRMLGLD